MSMGYASVRWPPLEEGYIYPMKDGRYFRFARYVDEAGNAEGEVWAATEFGSGPEPHTLHVSALDLKRR